MSPERPRVAVVNDNVRFKTAIQRALDRDGYDVHRFEPDRKLILGGVDVPSPVTSLPLPWVNLKPDPHSASRSQTWVAGLPLQVRDWLVVLM